MVALGVLGLAAGLVVFLVEVAMLWSFSRGPLAQATMQTSSSSVREMGLVVIGSVI